MTDIAQADILYLRRVKVRLLDDLLQDFEDNAIERSVLEPSLPALCERRADGESDDDVVGVLLGAVQTSWSASCIVSHEGGELRPADSHLVQRRLAWEELAENGLDTFGSHGERGIWDVCGIV